MNTQQNQLRSVLQALALPVTGQLRLYPDEVCTVSRLVQEFEQHEPLFMVETSDSLTERQKAVLASLHHDLMRVCLDHTCADLALRRNEVWQRVRLLARTALLAFNWPLALPTLPQPVPA